MPKRLSVTLNLKNRKVVIIGGGKIATRKVKQLIHTQANIIVIAPHISEEILSNKAIQSYQRSYQTGDLDQAMLIYLCTDNVDITNQVQQDRKDYQLINNCSNQNYSDFFSQATFEHDIFTISIHSQGKSPSKTKKFKVYLQKLLKKDDNSSS